MKFSDEIHLPVTVIIATKNEAANLPRCLASLNPASKVLVIDSNSSDATASIVEHYKADLVQFQYFGGYPKKRQWALDNLKIDTPWILLIDADEVVPIQLWVEIGQAINNQNIYSAFLITKGFHFLGKLIKYGGFSHSAILIFRSGSAQFEKILEDDCDGLDMEIHERILVDGRIGKLATPLVHEDFKGLESYIQKHNKYSTWEARLRYQYLNSGKYGQNTITPNFLGNAQERRRAFKKYIIHIPFEGCLWFFYHYIFRFGFLEGKAGLIACQIRAAYISQVKAKLFELTNKSSNSEN